MNDTTQQTYRVLARKYRPETFSELIGQEALVRTLSNALTLGRLAHAFVLTGVRGIGKTSTARLLAKGLNCIGADGNGGATLEPCGQCEPCQAIAGGRHVDVLEMDAASHTGVDDAREIIEGVGYRPVSARYKIYIIDEVHMMSKNAFNALLKTLEEPPDAVKFIFATTEIRKVPVTILSRCQRYDLRRVPAGLLVDHLATICQKETIDAQPEALAMIARAAEGSVRDALSLLDQAAAMTADALTPELVADMLGRPGRSESQAVLTAALAGDTNAALTAFANAYARGAEPDMLVADLLDLIHLASMQAAGAASDDLIDSDKATVLSLAEFGIARLGRAWQLLLKGHGELAHAPDPAAGCDMLIIRLAHAAQMPTPGDILQKLPTAPVATTNDAAAAAPAPTEPSPASAERADQPASSLQAPSLQAPSLPESGSHAESHRDDADQRHTATSVNEPPPDMSERPNTGAHPASIPTTLTDIVALAETHNEMLLAARIRNHVRLVALQSGRLEIALTGNAPETLAGDLTKQLGQWTGQRWLVSLSDEQGGTTLAEDTAAAAAKIHDAIAEDPLVAKIMEIFPGASIDSITAAASPETNPQNSDDTASANNEEMSG
ncbi:DNA polymerase III subunit gamma/tau [Alphaproteobacteria bacterium]|nr:DNA polymerase III subunit gamma/tau [Alphaproteobacteria bacterium]